MPMFCYAFQLWLESHANYYSSCPLLNRFWSLYSALSWQATSGNLVGSAGSHVRKLPQLVISGVIGNLASPVYGTPTQNTLAILELPSKIRWGNMALCGAPLGELGTPRRYSLMNWIADLDWGCQSWLTCVAIYVTRHTSICGLNCYALVRCQKYMMMWLSVTRVGTVTIG